MMAITMRCKVCREHKIVKVPIEGYLAWRHGLKHIQDAMPLVPAGERELLKSGICEPCFDRLFGGLK
jgi:hypothetical protein